MVGVEQHLRAYRALPDLFDVAAVADPSPERLEIARRAAQLANEDAHLDPFVLVRRGDVDLVDVCTPPAFRTAIAVAAARAGKHVIAEKPLASRAADAHSIVAAVRETGVLGAMVHNFLFLPEVQRAIALVRSGLIGVPELVLLNWLGVDDLPGATEYDATWRHVSAVSGGGVLLDMIHAVYVAEALLGERFVRASGYVQRRSGGNGVEDLAACRFEGRQAAALVNVAWGFGPAGAAISGSDGWIKLTQPEGEPSDFDRLERLTAGRGGLVQLDEDLRVPRAYERSFELVFVEIAKAIRDPTRPVARVEDGLHVLEAAMAAYRSARTGHVEQIST